VHRGIDQTTLSVWQASSTRRSYLDAGRLGIRVGDGWLPNPGPEKILDSYYSFPISVWRATLNYQLMTSLAYNRDRCPVSVFGARLCAQFRRCVSRSIGGAAG
jgi:high affinity Mn2+ porin